MIKETKTHLGLAPKELVIGDHTFLLWLWYSGTQWQASYEAGGYENYYVMGDTLEEALEKLSIKVKEEILKEKEDE